MTDTALATRPDNSLVAHGVQRLLHQYASVRPYDFVLIAYTPDSRVYAAHIVVALDRAGIAHRQVPMLPLADADFRDRLAAVLPAADSFAGNLVVITLERDTMSHFDVFGPLFGQYGAARCKIVRVISASDEFFAYAMNYSPQEHSARNATLLRFLDGARHIRVTTERGTDVTIELDQARFDWISNRGVWRPGGFTILPPGEIATYPARVTGTLVADGALNCNVVTSLDMRLGERPVTITIRDSVAESFHCDNPELTTLINDCYALDNGRRVGELGFGTNAAIPLFVAHNSHLNERRPGLHLGFGQHNQNSRVVGYYADVHLDVVTDDAVVTNLDSGESIRLSALVPRDGVTHPTLIRDQDITGDCCSAGCRVVAF